MKYLQMLLRELRCPQKEPTLIWEDNKACIHLAVNESSSPLTKPPTEVMFHRMIEMCLVSKDSQIVEHGHQLKGSLCTGYDSYMVYIC